jgi:hypothetical protein
VAGAIGNGPLGALGHTVEPTKIRSKAEKDNIDEVPADMKNESCEVSAELGEESNSLQKRKDEDEYKPKKRKKTENFTAEEVATVMATCMKSGLEGCSVMFDLYLKSKVRSMLWSMILFLS